MGYRTTDGGEFECPHCKSMYRVTFHQTPFRDRDTADCVVCGKQMDSWSSSTFKTFELIKRTK